MADIQAHLRFLPMSAQKVRLVVSELFLKTRDSDCLFHAIRQNRPHGTRMLAHTVHRT